MARTRTVLKTILRLLNKQPMTRGDLVRKTGKSRKVIGQNSKIALEEGLVRQDRLERFHLTMLGKTTFNAYVERRNDRTSWQIRSQVIDNIGLTPNTPSAKCTLMIKDAEKIKGLDNKTAFDIRYNLELPENATAIKSALARIVDSVLETIGKDMGLYTVRDGQLAESLSAFGIQQYYPGYDFLKRYMKLADINFKVLIEFDGKKWVRAQKFNYIERFVNDSRKFYEFYEFYVRQILLQDRRKRINEALQRLADRQDWNKVKDSEKNSCFNILDPME